MLYYDGTDFCFSRENHPISGLGMHRFKKNRDNLHWFLLSGGGRGDRKVDCEWCDKLLQYEVICTPLRSDEVERVFLSVVEEAKAKIERCVDSDTSHFTLPMTKQFIIDNFGPSVFQVMSGVNCTV